jgi:hypothetical protein
VLGSDRDDAAPGVLSRLGAPWRVAAAAALVGLAAWLGPDLLSATDPEVAHRATRSTPDTPSGAAVPLPVRGDLAGDATFVTAALRRVRSDYSDADRVLFAGRLPNGGRVAFVGRDRDEPAGVRALDVYALRVPPGADVEAGEVTVVGRGLMESTTLLDAGGPARHRVRA